MKSSFNSIHFKTMLSYFILAMAIIAAYKLIMGIEILLDSVIWFLNVISPFILGFLLAYVLNIPCKGIQRILMKSQNKFIGKKSKIISIVTTYLILFFIVYLIIRLVVPSLYDSISFFVSNFNNYYRSIQAFINYINELDLPSLNISTNEIMASIQEFSLQKLPSSINALFNFSTGLFKGFLALVSSFYILLEKEKFKQYMNRLMEAFLPDYVFHTMIKYTQILNTSCKQYIYTQTIDGCILGTIATIELYLLKSPYALVLGIMLGIVNYIPYFGSIFGSIFTVLVVAFTQDYTTAALSAVILLITQQIDANIIQPRLMSGSFSLSPLLVIISISFGGALSGVLGMIVAIPIVAVIKEILEEIIVYYEKRKSIDASES